MLVEYDQKRECSPKLGSIQDYTQPADCIQSTEQNYSNRILFYIIYLRHLLEFIFQNMYMF